MATSPPMVFYDIAMRPPIAETCCSPNPWKARYALNLKGVSYRTSWVELPDIASVRRGLGVPASRKFADGSDYHTLPMLSDPARGQILGDSFDIAVYLQKTYAAAGAGDLFPPQTLDYAFSHDLMVFAPLTKREREENPPAAEYARFNTNVDAAFSAHVLLMVHGLPFPAATAGASRAAFVQRAGVASWDDLTVRGSQREALKASLCDKLGGLARMWVRDASGPFLLGRRVSYADCIVGAWLRMMQVTLPGEEWEEVRGWYRGVFARLHDALQKYAEVK